MSKDKISFLDNFKSKDQYLLKNFFKDLNNNISLTKKETKLFNLDFEKAILYFYRHKIKVTEILKTLSVSKLGDCYKVPTSNWYPLDNAAKIYPLSMKDNWMNVFRISYYLKENIVPEIFQIALLFTMKRFPTFRTSIRKGFFWHYIDGIKKRFYVQEDNMLPVSYINVSNIGKQSFKALYYKNRVSVEYFHILTDGYGATIFLSTLVGVYLSLMGKNITHNELVLNIEDKFNKEEVIDSFTTQETPNKTRSFIESSALQIDCKLSNIRPCRILHFDMNLNELKKIAKEKEATITEFVLTLIFMALAYSTSNDGYIKVQVPVNMRKYYANKTLRNFALYVVISIKKSSITDMDSLLQEVKKQLHEKNSKEVLEQTISYTNKLVNSIKFIPLFIKKPIASLVYGYLGDRVLTTVLSNLGNINLPEKFKMNVLKMDFVLGTGITNRLLFGMICCNDIVTLSISKATLNTAVENSLYDMFKNYGISVKIHGSELYESRN